MKQQEVTLHALIDAPFDTIAVADKKGTLLSISAAVHDKLSLAKSFSNINFNTYIQDLIQNLFRSSLLKSRIRLELDVQDIIVGIDDAIPLALIIKELFTNAIKQAFPCDKKGTIKIKFHATADGS